MDKSDTRRIQSEDLAEALALLTRLPVTATGLRGVHAAWAWPLAGAAIAIIGAILGGIASVFGLPETIVAGIILASGIVLSGAMHEDGIADCADGFWGGWTTERRLEIMKDSRIGTYGVLALILSVLIRWAALVALLQAGWMVAPLIAAAVISRAAMVAVMHRLPPARENGLSRDTGRPQMDDVIMASIVAALPALLLCGFAAVPAGIAAGLVTLGMVKLAQVKIGGQTGDVLGASQQIAEIAVLITLAAIAT